MRNTQSSYPSYRRIIANTSIGAAILFLRHPYIGSHYRDSLIECRKIHLHFLLKLKYIIVGETPNFPTCSVAIMLIASGIRALAWMKKEGKKSDMKLAFRFCLYIYTSFDSLRSLVGNIGNLVS